MFPGKRPKPDEEPAQTSRELDEQEQLIAWRYLMLLELGFTPDDSLHLVRDPHLSWHEARRLLRKGCPPELVIRILEQ